jgi:hypothetical protein
MPHTSHPPASDAGSDSHAVRLSARTGMTGPDQSRALTLVEVMISLFFLGMVMLGLIGNFVQSRRISESTVLHAAVTSLLYGVIEQVKELDYYSLLPNYETDPSVPVVSGEPIADPPYIRVRLNQEDIIWIMVVHTPVTDEDATTTTIPYPQGPTTTPAVNLVAADVGAIDNFTGEIALSTVTGTTSQRVNLNIWMWIDEISNKGTWSGEGTQPEPDTSNVKKITIIYTYQYRDGNVTRTVRDREVILRTPFDQ